MGNFLPGDCVRLTPSRGADAAGHLSSLSIAVRSQLPDRGEARHAA